MKHNGKSGANNQLDTTQVGELVLQSIEREIGGVEIYVAALECAMNPELRKEWQRYLEQTRTHVATLENVCEALGLDPEEETPGRAVVRHVGTSLAQAIRMAMAAGDPSAAQIVACECIVLAESRDHLDWSLIATCAEHMTGEQADTLAEACEQVEDQEDEHLYHTKGWCRELWIASLGLKAMLPPPEEIKDVEMAIGAVRAEQAAEKTQ